jgi:anthranilate synthase component I
MSGGIVTKTLVADGLTPVLAYALLRKASGGHASFLLESVVGGERWGRFSVLGYRPTYEARLDRDGWKIHPSDARPLPSDRTGDPLTVASRLFPFAPARDSSSATMAERLARSHVGYFAWDIVHTTERVPDFAGATGPLARFFGGATTIVFDNLAQTLTIAAQDAADVERAAEDLGGTAKLRQVAVPDHARIPADVEVSIDDARFMAMIERAKEYIAAGDAFQIVLARTFSVPQGDRDPFDVYRAMRVINPSPYMYFIDMPATLSESEGEAAGDAARTGTQILGASPETLVRLEGEGALKKMTVRPLAGTRPRGRTPAEDDLRATELLADPKERAEHVMLIDLGRNDVGRVANVGSVRLLRRMEIERYSHVMHLLSEVEGEVDTSRVSPFEVLRAAFPAGTLSGAPKLRAMQIIRELEGQPRGVYGGAVGYFAETGEIDFAIAIRTAVCKDGRFEVTAGAGVVEASVPEHEVAETRNKAKAVLASIEAATRR